MKRIVFFLGFLVLLVPLVHADGAIQRLQDFFQKIIVEETEKIAHTDVDDRYELAQLYVSRGESFLLCSEHEKALEDFRSAHEHIALAKSFHVTDILEFRALFGQVISYDYVKKEEECKGALQVLANVVENFVSHGCSGSACSREDASTLMDGGACIEQCRRRIRPADGAIAGPDTLPEGETNQSWCEKVVVGLGRSMNGMASSSSFVVRVMLENFVRVLVDRGLTCCRNGTFWKTCATPLVKKWQHWKNCFSAGIYPCPENVDGFVKEN